VAAVSYRTTLTQTDTLEIKMAESEPLRIPIDGALDLHTFLPQEVKDLLPDYLEACGEKGLLEVRVSRQGDRSAAGCRPCDSAAVALRPSLSVGRAKNAAAGALPLYGSQVLQRPALTGTVQDQRTRFKKASTLHANERPTFPLKKLCRI
jgi:hypothetical protein